MPVQRCSKGGRPGFKWGSEGTCYTYTPGSNSGADAARARAARQGRAIEASKHARRRFGGARRTY